MNRINIGIVQDLAMSGKSDGRHDDNNYFTSNQSFGFGYAFDVPRATKDVKNQATKMVKTEYLLMNGYTLVGNVGGTLGMFVGFSFIGAIEWILDGIKKLARAD